MRTPIPFRFPAIDFLRSGPALGRTEDDHRPARALDRTLGPGFVLDGPDLADHRAQGRRHTLVHLCGLVALDEIRPVAVADEQALQLLAGNARQHAGIGYLVAVQVQDWQYRAVLRGVEKFI